MLWVGLRIGVYHTQFSVAYTFLCPHFWARYLMLVTVTYRYWLKGWVIKWPVKLRTFFYFFSQNPKKTWLFTFFWVADHVFSNTTFTVTTLLRYGLLSRVWSEDGLSSKGQNPLHQFPRNKSVTNPKQVGAGKSPLCPLCRVVSQIPLQQLVADLLQTRWPCR